MITLTLLHPNKSIPLQNWIFENESLIRIGRATDNNVVLYSAVVSRHHVEIRRNSSDWELENLGTNGTFLEGKPITKIAVIDGMIFRLASSGPQIQIRLSDGQSQPRLSVGQAQKAATENAESSAKETMTSDQ